MKRVVTFGEIMLRLATNGYYRFFQNDQMQATFGGAKLMFRYPLQITDLIPLLLQNYLSTLSVRRQLIPCVISALIPPIS